MTNTNINGVIIGVDTQNLSMVPWQSITTATD